MRAWIWHLCGVGAAGLAAAAMPASTARVVLVLLCFVTVLAAVVGGIRRHRPPHPLGWWLLLAGLSAALLCNLAGPILVGAGLAGEFTVYNITFFSTFPLLALVLAVLPVQGRRHLRFAGLTEAGIIASGVAVLWWTLLVDPLVFDPGGRVPGQLAVAAHPMLDMIVFGLGVRLVLTGATRSPAYLMVTLGTMAMTAADTMLFIGSIRGWATPPAAFVVVLAGNALFGSAALHPSMALVPPEAAPDDSAADIGTAWVYVVTVVASPLITIAFLLHESRTTGVQQVDIVVPVGAIAVTSALVVTRMRQLNKLARRRARDLELALRSEAELQGELRRRAQHDVLTGLPNRTLLYERITAALAAGAPGALFVLDLDGFKDVNDRFGHAMGDDLLSAAAARLRTEVGARGLVARLDSDEFAVLYDEDPGAPASACAERVLTAMRRPVHVQGHELFAPVSIGLRRLDEDSLTADVLRDAYLALHAAKAAGRDQLITFDQKLREERLAAARTVERLRGAVDRDELLVHYQPLVRLADERMTGVEALVRWLPRGADRPVPPDRFIPAAEDSGLIVPIGLWVLRESCRVVSEWHQATGAVVSVNVSPRQLREPDFGAQVLDALRSAGLPPSALILEITEGVLVASGLVTELAITHLSMLRSHGVRVAVDDFGTGYSSLSYLRNLPIDHVKIDKSFLPQPGESDPAPRTMVKAVIDLAAGLRLGTIAEGVETAEQVALLRELGCERAQGYYYARPVPAAEAAVLLADSAARTAQV